MGLLDKAFDGCLWEGCIKDLWSSATYSWWWIYINFVIFVKRLYVRFVPKCCRFLMVRIHSRYNEPWSMLPSMRDPCHGEMNLVGKTKKNQSNWLKLKTFGSEPILLKISPDVVVTHPWIRWHSTFFDCGCVMGTIVIDAQFVVEFSNTACLHWCTYPLIIELRIRIRLEDGLLRLGNLYCWSGVGDLHVARWSLSQTSDLEVDNQENINR